MFTSGAIKRALRLLTLIALTMGLVGVAGLACAQVPASITVRAASPHWETNNPGATYPLTVRFSATAPTSAPRTAFVHVVDSGNRIVFQAEHQPPVPTSQWRGEQSYVVPVTLPANLPDGGYRVAVGLYDPSNSSQRLALVQGSRVTEVTPDSRSYVVAQLVTVRRTIRRANLACNGTDDTASLNAALASLQPGDTLKLPVGTCRYRGVLRINSKSDVEVVGSGRDDTVLLTANPDSSALVTSSSDAVLIRDLALKGEATVDRVDHGEGRGLYVERSSNIKIQRTRIVNTAGAGIALWRVQDAQILKNEVLNTRADGIHVTGGTRNVLIEGNFAANTGDDSFASVGYQQEAASLGPNDNIVIRDNRSQNSYASGVAVEGSTNVTVTGNTIEASGVAGIRIASVASIYNTGGVSSVTVSGNTLTRVRTRMAEDHAAIMVFADQANLSGVRITSNRIENPNTWDAIRIRGSKAKNLKVSDVQVEANEFIDSLGVLKACVTLGDLTYNVSRTGNTFNGALCR